MRRIAALQKDIVITCNKCGCRFFYTKGNCTTGDKPTWLLKSIYKAFGYLPIYTICPECKNLVCIGYTENVTIKEK